MSKNRLSKILVQDLLREKPKPKIKEWTYSSESDELEVHSVSMAYNLLGSQEWKKLGIFYQVKDIVENTNTFSMTGDVVSPIYKKVYSQTKFQFLIECSPENTNWFKRQFTETKDGREYEEEKDFCIIVRQGETLFIKGIVLAYNYEINNGTNYLDIELSIKGQLDLKGLGGRQHTI